MKADGSFRAPIPIIPGGNCSKEFPTEYGAVLATGGKGTGPSCLRLRSCNSLSVLHDWCMLVESKHSLVTVAQLAEHRVVVPKVAGSSPVGHPGFCR
jgi:hypothetical protein